MCYSDSVCYLGGCQHVLGGVRCLLRYYVQVPGVPEKCLHSVLGFLCLVANFVRD